MEAMGGTQVEKEQVRHMGDRYCGKCLFSTRNDFLRWVREDISEWASAALEDVAAVKREMHEDHAPTSYPCIVVWKGVKELDWWYVYPNDFNEAACDEVEA